MPMPIVWLVESGEYEQRGVFGVYASVAAAVAGIKDTYSEPYVVSWQALAEVGDEWQLVGDFARVPGYCVNHRGVYDIRPCVLQGALSGQSPATREAPTLGSDSLVNEGKA